MLPASLIGILFAITSAITWGSGDFSGGQAARKSHQYQVLLLAAFSGMIVLAISAIIRGETIPSLRTIFWSFLAGAAGALGMAALYRALSLGHTASVAPTSAITCAAFPVVLGLITAGLPKLTVLVGMVVAFAAIWLVSQSPSAGEKTFREGMVLSFFSGIGFGGFFVFIAQVDKGPVFIPVLIARTITLVISLVMLGVKRIRLPSLASNPVALLAGVLDTGGNVFYLLATQYTRLDIVGLLSSFYPAMTVVLASILLKEKVAPPQRVGLVLCLVALALMTL